MARGAGRHAAAAAVGTALRALDRVDVGSWILEKRLDGVSLNVSF